MFIGKQKRVFTVEPLHEVVPKPKPQQPVYKDDVKTDAPAKPASR
jgi:hypothetical protein